MPSPSIRSDLLALDRCANTGGLHAQVRSGLDDIEPRIGLVAHNSPANPHAGQEALVVTTSGTGRLLRERIERRAALDAKDV
jgi:hypothetical protein